MKRQLRVLVVTGVIVAWCITGWLGSVIGIHALQRINPDYKSTKADYVMALLGPMNLLGAWLVSRQ